MTSSLLCIGLDSELARLPPHLLGLEHPQFEFNKVIIDATRDLVCAYKPNMAFYEAEGQRGLESLEKTIAYIAGLVPVILDCKRGDIGNTSRLYARACFDQLGADAVTLHGYMGEETVAPFLAYEGKTAYVLVKTSNASAASIQDLKLDNGRKIFEMMADRVREWNVKYPGTCGAVVGATYPDDIRRVREILPDVPFLIPGLGKQGGDVKNTVKNGLDRNGGGIVVSSAREIIFASSGEDFAEAARGKAVETRDLINSYR